MNTEQLKKYAKELKKAVKDQNEDSVKTLLARATDQDLYNIKKPILHYSIPNYKNTTIFEMLIERNFNLTVKNAADSTILGSVLARVDWAQYSSHIVKILSKQSFDQNYIDIKSCGNIPILVAASIGYLPFVEWYHEQRTCHNLYDYKDYGDSIYKKAIRFAKTYKRQNVVDYLEKIVGTSPQNMNSTQLQSFAKKLRKAVIAKNNDKVVELLKLATDDDLYKIDIPILHNAINEYKYLELFDILIARNFNLSIKDGFNLKVINLALREFSLQPKYTEKILSKQTCKQNFKDILEHNHYESEVFYIAACCGDLPLLQYCRENKYVIISNFEYNNTIASAKASNHQAVVDYLQKNNATQNVSNKNSENIKNIAKEMKMTVFAKELKKAVNDQNTDKVIYLLTQVTDEELFKLDKPILHYSILRDNSTIFDILIERNFNLHVKDSNGHTVLSHIIRSNSNSWMCFLNFITKILSKQSCQQNFNDIEACEINPILVAAAIGDLPFVQWCCKHVKYDKNVDYGNFQQALKNAQLYNHQAVVDYLQQLVLNENGWNIRLAKIDAYDSRPSHESNEEIKLGQEVAEIRLEVTAAFFAYNNNGKYTYFSDTNMYTPTIIPDTNDDNDDSSSDASGSSIDNDDSSSDASGSSIDDDDSSSNDSGSGDDDDDSIGSDDDDDDNRCVFLVLDDKLKNITKIEQDYFTEYSNNACEQFIKNEQTHIPNHYNNIVIKCINNHAEYVTQMLELPRYEKVDYCELVTAALTAEKYELVQNFSKKRDDKILHLILNHPNNINFCKYMLYK